MNLSLRKALSCLLALVLVLSLIPCTQAAATSADEDFYYGRSALAKLDNAESLLYAYDQIAAGIETAAAQISVRNGYKTHVSETEFEMVMDAYLRDHSEIFWFSGRYGYAKSSDGSVKFIVPTYAYTGATLTQMRATFDQQISVFTAGIRDTMTDYEKELYLHEALAGFITYGYLSGDNQTLSHTAYGAMVNGLAVCDGYAKAFQTLLHAVGIRSFIINGTSVNTSGDVAGHAWNCVEIDGNFYHVDLTWDDQNSSTYHAYLNVDDATILEDHTIDPTGYALPVCDKDEAFYFKYLPVYVETYTVESIAQLLIDHGMQVALYIHGDREAFHTWYKANIRAIAKAAGVTGGFSYSCSHLGHETHIAIKVNCNHSQMTYVPGVEPDCVNTGMVAHYACKCNKWFEDADATVEYEHHHDLILPALGHDYSKLIRTPDYLLHTPENCQDAFAYYYACSRCSDSAGNQEATQHLWYFYGNGEHKYALTDGKALCSFCGKEASVGAAWANNKLYSTLSEALKFTTSGTITMLQDANMGSITVPAGVTLDINGHDLVTDVLLSFGDVIDSRDGIGHVYTDEFASAENSQVVLWDHENECFRLFACETKALGTKLHGDAVTFGFSILFQNQDAYRLLAGGRTGFAVETKLDYGIGSKNVAFSREILQKYADNCLKYPQLQSAMLLHVTGLQYLPAGGTLTVTPNFYALDGDIAYAGASQSYSK